MSLFPPSFWRQVMAQYDSRNFTPPAGGQPSIGPLGAPAGVCDFDTAALAYTAAQKREASLKERLQEVEAHAEQLAAELAVARFEKYAARQAFRQAAGDSRL